MASQSYNEDQAVRELGRCDERVQRPGMGSPAFCDRPLDESGYCDRPGDHIEES